MATDTVIAARTPDAETVVRAALADYHIPEHLRAGLVRYLVDGIKPGLFLTAVLENNLQEAVMRAGYDVSFLDLRQLLLFLYNETPAPCYGSPAKVAAWLKERKAVDRA